MATHAPTATAPGLLEVEDGTYRNGKAAARFLSGPGPHDLRPFLRFWDKISCPTWTRLAEALASGPPREIFQLDGELQQVAPAGIEAILAGPATALPEVFDFGPAPAAARRRRWHRLMVDRHRPASPAPHRSRPRAAHSRRAGPHSGGRRGPWAPDHRDHRRRLQRGGGSRLAGSHRVALHRSPPTRRPVKPRCRRSGVSTGPLRDRRVTATAARTTRWRGGRGPRG
jgi:hypothetical protein